MANMSYCRFENTANDLADCLEHFEDCNLSSYEANARRRILRMAQEIVESFTEEDLDFLEDSEVYYGG